MENFNSDPSQDNPSPEEEHPRGKRFAATLKSLLAFLVLVAVVIASFWICFQLGKRLFVPRKGPQRKIDVEIPAPPLALQELQKEMTKESQPMVTTASREVRKLLVIPKGKGAVPYRSRTQTKKLASKTPEKAYEPKTAYGPHYYKVQAGVFKDKALAQALAEKIKSAGFDTYVKKVAAGWRVQVGAFRNKSQAQALQSKLSGKGFKSIVLYE